MKLIAIVAFILSLSKSPSIIADDAKNTVAALPPVGSWVRYRVVTVQENGTETTYDETVTWQEKELDSQGRDCRWIESRIILDDEKCTYATRIFVPEQALLKDPDPLRQTVKLQRSENDRPVSEFPLYFAPLYTYAVLNSPGIKSEVATLDDPKTVKYQHGDLSIAEERSASLQWTRQLQAGFRQDTNYEAMYYTHPSVDAGVAEATIKLTIKYDGRLRASSQTYYLMDAGDKESSNIKTSRFQE
ncbi:MAG: hypothetical protein WEB58_15305 [Planctomycetaceae bacterium]